MAGKRKRRSKTTKKAAPEAAATTKSRKSARASRGKGGTTAAQKKRKRAADATATGAVIGLDVTADSEQGGTKRRVGRKDIGVSNVFFLPPATIRAFATLRRLGEDDEIYKTEALDLIVDGNLEGLVAGLVALRVEAMPPRKERKSIRLQISKAANAALESGSALTGLDKLQLLVAAIELAAEQASGSE